VHESLAPGLRIAANQPRAQGNTLVFWDCYRPHDVQVRMFQAVPNPNWVARPRNYARSHEAGRSVDVTIAGLDMGTDFDDFTARGLAYATGGITAQQQASDG
jgi:D-alanyl-D-alanine dipeptidase